MLGKDIRGHARLRLRDYPPYIYHTHTIYTATNTNTFQYLNTSITRQITRYITQPKKNIGFFVKRGFSRFLLCVHPTIHMSVTLSSLMKTLPIDFTLFIQ